MNACPNRTCGSRVATSPDRLAVLLLAALLPGPGRAGAGGRDRAAAAPPQAAPPKDALGRDTPRGTVLGFMNAARAAHDEVAAQYLNTTLRDRAAVDLAHQLFVSSTAACRRVSTS